MPKTRSQAANEETAIREHVNEPALPSVSDLPSAYLPTSESRPITASFTMPTAPAPVTAMERPRSRAPSIHSQRSTTSLRIRKAELEAEERLAELQRKELEIQANLIKKRLAADIETIREESERESLCEQEDILETNQRVSEWDNHTQPRGEKVAEATTTAPARTDTERAKETERCTVAPPQVTFKTSAKHLLSHRESPSEQRTDRLADAVEKMTRGRKYMKPPDLPTFTGGPGQWLPFKAAVREATTVYDIPPVESLARLRASLQGEARQCVAALLYTATEPSTIMATLEQRYGQPEIIIDQALEDLKKLPSIGSTAAELNDFAIKLQNIVTVISCLDEKGYLQNPMLARHITEKMSEHLRSRWCDYAEEHGIRNEAEIVTLSRFFMREAQRVVRHCYSTPVSHTQVRTRLTNRDTSHRLTNRSTRANVYATSEAPKRITCYCCGGEHATPQCKKLSEMNVEERWRWVKETKICFLCINNKHRRFVCKAKKCGVDECRMTHHALLHSHSGQRNETPLPKEDSAITASARAQASQRVLLKVCPITIRGSKGEVETFGLLDEGSTISLIDDELAAQIGVQGPTRPLNIHGATSSQREASSQAVDIEVKGRKQKDYYAIKVRTVQHLTLGSQSVKQELLNQRHLRNLRPEDVCYSDARPRVLIGADNWHLIVSRKLLTGKRTQPAASLTKIGWVIHGTTPQSTIMSQDERTLHIRTTQERDSEIHHLAKTHFELESSKLSNKTKPVTANECAVEIFNRKSCGFDLAGRSSNRPQLPGGVDSSDRATTLKELRVNGNEYGKILGLKWIASDVEVLAIRTTEESRIVDFTRFSSYERLLRKQVKVMKFYDKCRKRENETDVDRVKRSERLLLQQAQQETFPEEIKRLRAGNIVERTSRLVKLDPVYTEEEILRLRGRINAALVPKEMKAPPILSGEHPLSRLLIKHEHERSGHIGREHVVNNVRQKYWILRLRTTVRKITRECIWCSIKRKPPGIPVKGDLPKERLDAYTRPFSRCGQDGFGPMWVTIGRRREKRWGLLFTCLVSRAVHVELLASLSTDSAIMAIRRMAARRGFPVTFYSDHGTNFHGSVVEMKKAYEEWLPSLKEFMFRKKIEWRYIDPGAPNQGGAWERLIRRVKTALALTLTDKAPKEEVLVTALTEIEYTINSRPLTHVSVCEEYPEALTPNHLLLGTALGLPIVGECDIADRRAWRGAQGIANAFWASWVREYLPTLTPRGDVRRPTRNLEKGDVVIIADGLLPRGVWPRGVIEAVHTGPDGVVRSADVRTRGGIFRRPVRRLVVLPSEKGYENLRRGEAVADNEDTHSLRTFS